MKKIKLLVVGLLAAGSLAAYAFTPTGTPGIVGSVHDFSINSNYWFYLTYTTNGDSSVTTNVIKGYTSDPTTGTNKNWLSTSTTSAPNVCGECHTIHNAPNGDIAPLFVHDKSKNATFTPYTSPTLDATPGTPGWASLACLSCHDGSTAINSIDGVIKGGQEVKISTTSTAAIGVNGDLSATHPIGIDYDEAAGLDRLIQPSSTVVANADLDNGKTIAQFMLFKEGGKNRLECATCHDIHRYKGHSAYSGIFTKIGSATAPSALCLTCHLK